MSHRRKAAPPELEKMAEWRARGLSWEAVGREVKKSESTLHRWTKEFPREWQAALRKFETMIRREALAESVLTLRKMLRSEDEKIGRSAAAELIRFVTSKQIVNKKTHSTSNPGTSEIAAIAEFVGGLSDDEMAILLRELQSRPADSGTDADASPEAAIVAARSE